MSGWECMDGSAWEFATKLVTARARPHFIEPLWVCLHVNETHAVRPHTDKWCGGQNPAGRKNIFYAALNPRKWNEHSGVQTLRRGAPVTLSVQRSWVGQKRSKMDAEPSFLEGVGDEVLIGLVSTLGIIALVSIVYNRRGGRRTVHPLQEEIVQITRNRLGFTTGSQEQNNEPAADGAANETPALPTAPPVTYSDDRNCPVCLNEARYLTMTNCGHVFCG